MMETTFLPAARPSSTWSDLVVDLDDDDIAEILAHPAAKPAAIDEAHDLVLSLLCHFLWSWAFPRRAGCVVVSSKAQRARDPTAVLPDLQFFRTGGAPPQRAVADEARPDLVVEVLSHETVRRDRVLSMRERAARGIGEIWLVDPAHRTLEALVLRGGRYTIAEAHCEDEVFRPRGFDGLEVPLADLWSLERPDQAAASSRSVTAV
jgi:Uma2 family endonuclease